MQRTPSPAVSVPCLFTVRMLGYAPDVSHNHSPRRVRAAIMSSKVRDFDGHQLEMDGGSPHCPRDRRYRIADLAGIYGRNTPFAALIHRLRCHTCGGGAFNVALVKQVGDHGTATIRLPLLGRGVEQ